jgi:hypothetical protein
LVKFKLTAPAIQTQRGRRVRKTRVRVQSFQPRMKYKKYWWKRRLGIHTTQTSPSTDERHESFRQVMTNIKSRGAHKSGELEIHETQEF